MVRGTTTAMTVALATALVLGACSSGQEAQEGPTDRPVSAECRQAFTEVPTESAELADPGPTAPPSPVPVGLGGAFVDMFPTVTDCESVEEWVEAFRGQNLEITRNADPVSTLRALCQSSDEERIRTAPVCQEVETPSVVADVKDNDKDNDADPDATETPGG